MSMYEIEDPNAYLFYGVLLPIALFVCLLVLFSGCASLIYEHTEYGRVEYRRWWSQEVGAVSIEIDGKPPIRLHMQRQKAEMPEVDKIAGAIAAGLVP